uniref:Uncharacterized protein n=1 Tax=Anguilla anguilla TaxID=7936 RepID=A0A0E9WQ28_ANGAN
MNQEKLSENYKVTITFQWMECQCHITMPIHSLQTANISHTFFVVCNFVKFYK